MTVKKHFKKAPKITNCVGKSFGDILCQKNDKCDKSVCQVGDLNKHMYFTKSKCDSCDKTFLRKDLLKK